MNYSYLVYDTLPEQFNLAAYLFGQVKPEELDKVAYYYNEQQLSYRELANQVKKFALLLSERGVGRGTRVAILLHDDINFVLAFLATLWLGAVAVIVNEANSDADIHYILDDCNARHIITKCEWYEKLHPVKKEISSWVLVDEAKFNLCLQEFGVINAVLVARETEAFWVYTSGSTGYPKGVIHAHYNPVVAIENYGKHILKLTSNDVILSAPPMAFSYGLGTSIYFPLFFKSSVVITSDASPFNYIDLISRYAVTSFFGIPHTYATIHAVKEIKSLDANSLRLCVSAGEQLAVSLLKSWKHDFGIEICEGIGTTESTHIFISNTEDCIVPGSSGRVVPGYCIRLVNDDGEEVPVGEAGLLEISGEGFMLGYWQKLKATHSALRGQTMRTGDLYRRDKSGNYYFLGRKDSLIKVKGMWVVPSEIEQTILQHSLVQETAVIVKNGSIDHVVEITAYLKLKNSGELNNSLRKEITDLILQKHPKHHVPRKYFALNDFPRTATGKIHRKKLAETVSSL